MRNVARIFGTITIGVLAAQSNWWLAVLAILLWGWGAGYIGGKRGA